MLDGTHRVVITSPELVHDSRLEPIWRCQQFTKNLAVVFDVAAKLTGIVCQQTSQLGHHCIRSSLQNMPLLVARNTQIINAQGRGRVSARTRPHWQALLNPATGRLCHSLKRSPQPRIPDGKAKKEGDPCCSPERL